MAATELTRQKLESFPCIHKGERSALYLQENSPYGKPVLIKVLRRDHATQLEKQRLVNECELTRELRLPGARSALDRVTVDGSEAIVLEFVQGETIAEATLGGKAPLPEILAIAVSAARSLEQLHRSRIVHCNISSANIIVSADRAGATLIDFGMARRVEALPLRADAGPIPADSLPYISPELTGRIDLPVDHRSDLYSLGVVLYQALTGRFPFAAASPTELVHCHLALNPTAPARVAPELPDPVSDIVLKLLAKSPDDRYQSAHGVRVDLERCLALLVKGEPLERFVPGREDFAEVLRVPRMNYGREREQQLLHEALVRACNGSCELLLVSGEAGTGKSMLVGSMQQEVAAADGYFIRGRFEEYQTNIPYHALIQALTELIDLVLIESAEQLAQWQARLTEAVGGNGALLVEVLPRLELIVGKQEPVQGLGLVEARNRFHHVFRNFVRGAAGKGRPLVLFLDNLQRADAASLRLLVQLLGAGATHLLVVGAYRKGEVGPDHPLSTVLDALKRQKTPLLAVDLPNLGKKSIGAMVAGMMGCAPIQARSLADVVHRKTAGNPLFAVQFMQSLYAEGLVFFSPHLSRWQWDTEQIGKQEITDNVVLLMARKMERLPGSCRDVLAKAACLGSRFSLADLAAVACRPGNEILESLAPALEAGLLTVAEDNRRLKAARTARERQDVLLEFLHDRVRKLAYSSLSRKKRRSVHLHIGRLRLARISPAELEERVFEIVDHLNEGFSLLEGERERLRLIEINLVAGRKAKRAAAYGASIWYLSMGIGMLPPDKWDSSYNLSLSLYLEAVEGEYLCGNFERAELLADELLLHVRDYLVKARVHELRMLFHTAQNLPVPAIKAGLEALALLDLSLPQDADGLNRYTRKLRRQLSREALRVEEMADLPVLRDPQQLAVMQVLMNLTTPAHQANHPLLSAVIVTMVHLSRRHGNSPMSAFAYGWYAVLLCGDYDEVDLGYRFGRLSLVVIRQFHAVELEARILFLFNAFVRHWREHAREALLPLLEVQNKGVGAGDPEYAYYGAVHYLSHLFCTGASLDFILNRQADCLESVDRLHLEFHGHFARIWGEMVSRLADAGIGASPRAGGLAEERMLPLWMQQNSQVLLFALLCCKTVLQYLYGDCAGAVQSARLAERYEAGGEGALYLPLFKFFQALALLGEWPSVAPETQQEYLTQVAAIRDRMQRWAAAAPMNFRHRLDLVDAELARIRGDLTKATECLGEAMKGARETGHVQDEALAYEREAECRLAMGREDLAGHCVRKAADCFRLWGSVGKAAQLEKKFRHLLVTEKPTSFDTSAIIDASHMLSQELRLEQLLGKTMRLVIENAGAETGVLIENRDGRLVVQARGEIGQEQVAILQEKPIEESGEAPLSVINYVARTQSPVVLSDASRDSAYSGDRYIAERGTRSLLCMPIVHQGKLSGLLYLENNLATSVFTADRLELLKIIASQAAISMENARLYRDLLQENAERKRAELELGERMRQAGLAAEVGVALTAAQTLQTMLQCCAEAMVTHLDAAFARIWLLNEEDNVLELQASAGMYTHLDGPHGRIPVGSFKIGMIAQLRKPHMTNAVIGDPKISDQQWAQREGMTAFAGHPLIVADRLVGVMALFSRSPLNQSTTDALTAVADEIALGIVRKQTEETLHQHRNFLEQLVQRRTAELSEANGQLREEIAERSQIEEALNRRLLALTQPLEAFEVSFADLFDLDEIQRIQDAFAAANNVASMITQPDGTPITRPSNFCRLCRDIVRQTEKGRHNCAVSDALIGQQEEEGPRISLCLSGGLWDAGASITLGGKHVANWLVGQVRNEGVDEERVLRYADEIGADPVLFREAFREVPVMSQDQFGKVAQVLYLLARELSLKAYQNYQQARFILERKQAEEELRRYREHLEELVDERTTELTWSNVQLEKEISVRKRTEEDLRVTQFAVDCANDSAFWIDPQARIFYVNQAACRSLGYSSQELVSMAVQQIDPNFPGEKWTAQIERLRRQGGMTFESLHRRKDGCTFPVEVTANYVEIGGEAYTFAFVRDITGRKGAEAELKLHRDHLEELVKERTAELVVAKERAEVASQAKSTFLSSMSHELRTPMNAILGYAQILKRHDNLTESQRQQLEVIRGSGEHLLSLINDVLDMGKIEAQKMEIEEHRFDLSSLLRQVFNIGKVTADEKDLVFQFEQGSALPEQVRGDQRKLKQILLNLISNAVKYTRRGKVVVKVSYDPGPGLFRCRIDDTGIGIPRDKQEAIFEPFTQLTAPGQIREGTGLGLSITKRLVALMKGKLTVESECGKGSSFQVELPLSVVNVGEISRKVEGETISGYRGRRRTILLVDDNLTNVSVMVALLEPLGFAVLTAENGRDAVREALEHRPDLVLLDLVMPEADGLDAAREMRRRPELDGIRIVGTSATVTDSARKEAFEAMCDGFLIKPIVVEQLLEKLGSCLGIAWDTEAPVLQTECAPGGEDGEAPFEVPPMEELRGLHEHSLRGDMREIGVWAAQLAEREPKYHRFAAELQELARRFKANVIVALVERQMREPHER